MSILCDGTTKASSPNTFMRWKNCRYAVSIVQFLGTTRQENILHCLKRFEILHSDQSAMPSQIAETSPFPYWVEFVFNQFSMAVVDNVIVEYLFTIEFLPG